MSAMRCRFFLTFVGQLCAVGQQLATGLDVPSLMMVHEERDKGGKFLFEIPTMLRGLDAFYYEHSVDIGERLGNEVEGFLIRHKGRPSLGHILVLPDLARRDVNIISEDEIERRRNLLQSFRNQLAQLPEVTDQLELLVNALAQAAEADLVSLYPYDQVTDQFSPHPYFVGGTLSSHSMSPQAGPTARQAVQSPTRILVEDVDSEQVFKEYVGSFVSAERIRSFAALPLRTEKEVVGVLFVNFRQPHRFSEEDRDVLSTFAELATQVIQIDREKHRENIGRALLSGAHTVDDPTEKARAITKAVRQLANEEDIPGLDQALTLAQSIVGPVQQAEVLVALVDFMAQVRYSEGVRRAVEIALVTEEADAREQILKSASRAYENLGETQKARQVGRLISEGAIAETPYTESIPERPHEWLKSVGFVVNPVFDVEASRESSLPEYFVSPPSFDKLLAPRSSILYAKRGHGKTAYRTMLGRMLEKSSNLAVHYVTFVPLPVTLDDHVRALIKLIGHQASAASPAGHLVKARSR